MQNGTPLFAIHETGRELKAVLIVLNLKKFLRTPIELGSATIFSLFHFRVGDHRSELQAAASCFAGLSSASIER